MTNKAILAINLAARLRKEALLTKALLLSPVRYAIGLIIVTIDNLKSEPPRNRCTTFCDTLHAGNVFSRYIGAVQFQLMFSRVGGVKRRQPIQQFPCVGDAAFTLLLNLVLRRKKLTFQLQPFVINSESVRVHFKVAQIALVRSVTHYARKR